MKLKLKIFIIIVLVCLTTLLIGCISHDNGNNNDNANNKSEDTFLVIRIESISPNNESVYINKLFIDLTLGTKNKTISFNENIWQNVIRLESPIDQEQYTFKIKINITSEKDNTFRFVGPYDDIDGNIIFVNKKISINMNPKYNSSFTIEEKENGFNINTTGNDGGMKIVIAIEHPPP